MPLNNAGLNALATDLKNLAPFLSLHSAAAGSTGVNETTAPRQAANWTEATQEITASNVSFTGGAANGPVVEVGLWSLASGGVFYGSYPLTGDASFNASGAYTVDSLAIPFTAS